MAPTMSVAGAVKLAGPLDADGANFGSWSFAVEMVASDAGWWDYVSEEPSKAEEETPRAAGEASSSSASSANLARTSFAALTLLAGPDHFDGLRLLSERDGRAAWQYLVGKFQSTSRANRIQAKTSFYTSRHDPSKPISAFITSCSSSFLALRKIHPSVTDVDLADQLIGGLHSSYGSIRSSLSLKKEEVTSRDVIAALEAEELARLHDGQLVLEETGAGTGPEDERAAAATGGRGRSRRGGSKALKPGPANPCHKCGEAGHWAKDCPGESSGGGSEKVGLAADTSPSYMPRRFFHVAA